MTDKRNKEALILKMKIIFRFSLTEEEKNDKNENEFQFLV
jgi:hypothetical protein